MKIEERLVEIESKIAFQEDAVQELNKAIYQQQKQIDKLEAICQSLAQHVLDLKESIAERNLPHEKPPHY